MTSLAYVDSSSLLKLTLDELGSDEMHELAKTTDLVSSMLALTETSRRVRARPGDSDISGWRDRIQQVVFIPVDELVLRHAAEIDPVSLRTLDAIHLATAIRLGADLQMFVSSDRRLANVARDRGLHVVSPGLG